MVDKNLSADAPDGILARWARRKNQVRSGVEVGAAAPVVEALAPTPVALVANPQAAALAPAPVATEIEPVAPPPTLADVAVLTRDSDYSRFVTPGIDEGVKQAALRKLFTDPHFNVMDGLDTYIDDYGKPDPIPLAMLRQMNQSKFLRLFDDDEEEKDIADAAAAAALPVSPARPATISANATPPDDDSDLRLQQDDAAGPIGPAEGARA